MHLRAIDPAATAAVPEALARAASATGTEFSYLLGQARAESGLNPAARAHTSSASGLFQFVEGTWLSVVKRHGADAGLGWAADAIHWAGGKLHVADAAARRAILALRDDPAVSALMAGKHAADNKAALEARLGRTVGVAELGLAHFLGLGGATKFMRALADNPGGAAAHVAPHAVGANHSVFFTRAGAARTLEQVYDRIAARFDTATAPAPAHAPVQFAAVVTVGAVSPAPAYARAAYLMLATLGA